MEVVVVVVVVEVVVVVVVVVVLVVVVCTCTSSGSCPRPAAQPGNEPRPQEKFGGHRFFQSLSKPAHPGECTQRAYTPGKLHLEVSLGRGESSAPKLHQGSYRPTPPPSCWSSTYHGCCSSSPQGRTAPSEPREQDAKAWGQGQP